MERERWLELGLPEQAFEKLNSWYTEPDVTCFQAYTFSIKRRIWGLYWTIVAGYRRKTPIYTRLENETEIIHYRDQKTAENVLLLLALEGLKVEKYDNGISESAANLYFLIDVLYDKKK